MTRPGVTGAAPSESENGRRAWRQRRFREELLIRAALSILILVFDELSGRLWGGVGANPATRIAGLGELLLNGPYYLAARTGRWLRPQAYGRMTVDILFITLGLYGAGGAAAAPYIGMYTVIVVYAGIMFSSVACLTASAFATASFLTMALMQHAGRLPAAPPRAGAWATIAFNLLVLNIVAVLTAIAAEAYRQSRRQVRATEERFRVLAQSAPDAIVLADAAGRIVSWNRAAETMFGHAEAEVLGRPLTLLMPERYADAHRAGIARLAAGGESRIVGHTIELVGLAKDGREFPLELSLASWRTDGKTFFSGIIRDITERKQTEEQLRQSQKLEAIGSLAGGIAHDFNNLLTVIGGQNQFIAWRLPADDPLHRELAVIERTVARAAGLTRQLLAFSRKQVFQLRVVDMNAVLTPMDEMLRRLIGEHIQLVTLLGSELGRIKADPSQIEQVILNLAINAKDAMPDGGRLIIETSNAQLDDSFARGHVDVKAGPYVMLAVSDTGHGMDAQTKAKVFEPFFTTKEPGKGTGLGLSTVYGVVKQSGGHIWLYSERGHGATFKLYFPRVDGRLDEAEPGSAGPQQSRGTETILLAEDDDAVRALAQEILETSGYAVLAAQHPDEALAIAKRHPGPIHLLVTDVVMPGMSGRALADQLEPVRPGIRVLYVSGYTADAIVHHGVLEPGKEFLPKPYTPNALARRVRDILDRKG
ncbi:MAG TPA: PAS domain S-box protein [Methylomirabilota bacterium]|nr:PAS domain S-box protein [Methylomirabilota bacterium]